MDVGRTCGFAMIRFWRNSPLAVRVRWYRAPPGAKVFPGRHMFGLGYWDMDRLEWPGLGQIEPPALKYDTGWTPPTAHGLHVCGRPQDYLDGLDITAAGPPVRYDRWGIPTCCPGAGAPVPDWPVASAGSLALSFGHLPDVGNGLVLDGLDDLTASGLLALDADGPDTGDLVLDSEPFRP